MGLSVEHIDSKMKRFEEQGKTVMILTNKTDVLGLIGDRHWERGEGLVCNNCNFKIICDKTH